MSIRAAHAKCDLRTIATHSGSLTAGLEQCLAALASRKGIRHALISVESLDESFQWVGATGSAQPAGAEFQPDTPFFIASIDKLLNATLALKFVERGLLDLEAAVGSYLDATVMHGLHRLSGVEYSDSITVRHLLSHASGLADWLEDYPRGGCSVVDRVIRQGDATFGQEEMLTRVRTELRPHFPPPQRGTRPARVRYSDTNYVLLVAVMEAIARRPLHELHEQWLYRPLGLRHTWLPGHSRPLAATTDPAGLYAGGDPLHVPQLIRSLRGIYSTVGDLSALMRALVQGKVFDTPGTLRLMQEHWSRFGFPQDRAALRAPSWPIEYGLGIMRFQLPRILAPFRPVPSVIGHTGSTGCWLFYCQRQELVLAGTVNEVTAGAVPYRVVPRILRVTGGMDPTWRAAPRAA
jgi:D-alanyl-D-alanine carboxypeptidase